VEKWEPEPGLLTMSDCWFGTGTSRRGEDALDDRSRAYEADFSESTVGESDVMELDGPCKLVLYVKRGKGVKIIDAKVLPVERN
jgi:hypothetical protein